MDELVVGLGAKLAVAGADHLNECGLLLHRLEHEVAESEGADDDENIRTR